MNEALKQAIEAHQAAVPEGAKERASWEAFCQSAFLIYRDVWLARVAAKKGSAETPTGE